MNLPIRIGTRGSALALVQANAVRNALLAAHPDLGGDAVEIVPIVTTGDRVRDRPLTDIGGKGLFTMEIEQALAAGGIAMAVHSLKDMPAQMPPGLVIGCVPEREDPRDVFLSHIADRIADLPRGALLGSASARRQAQALRLRPDLRTTLLRGNVETRLRKLEAGEVDATILAAAGLRRLGRHDLAARAMPAAEMLPAVAQGAIGIEVREDDGAVRALLAPLNHGPSALAATAERGFLAELEGSCRTPLAALAEIEDGAIRLRARLFSLDGTTMVEAVRRGPAEQAESLGRDAGREVRSRAAPDLLPTAK
jgi:hydroxymethylbilane synthase